jgi:hypothetical protein
MARDSDGAQVLMYENRNANRRSRESGLISGINPEAVPPPGRTLRLSWPLTPDVFTGTATQRPANDHGHPSAENPDLPRLQRVGPKGPFQFRIGRISRDGHNQRPLPYVTALPESGRP